MTTNAIQGSVTNETNGAAMAAIVAAGVGAFAVGAVVLLAETGLWSAPSFYGPVGGLSGRTTVATAVWLLSWWALHARWRRHDVNSTWVLVTTTTLIIIGVLATFPPLWQLL